MNEKNQTPTAHDQRAANEIRPGTEVIAKGHPGSTFIYNGPLGRNGTRITIEVGSTGPARVNADPHNAAPADASEVQANDPRVSVFRDVGKRAPWVAIWPGGLARSKTKRDALAKALLALRIDDWHASKES